MILAPVRADLVSVGGIMGRSILKSHICCPRVGYLIEFRRLSLTGVAWNAGLHIVFSAFG